MHAIYLFVMLSYRSQKCNIPSCCLTETAPLPHYETCALKCVLTMKKPNMVCFGTCRATKFLDSTMSST